MSVAAIMLSLYDGSGKSNPVSNGTKRDKHILTKAQIKCISRYAKDLSVVKYRDSKYLLSSIFSYSEC